MRKPTHLIMRKFSLLFILISMLIPAVSSCQEDYIMEIADRPTDTIEFTDITASKDSACMFDTIVLTANAKGENLKYTWQRAKGSMVAVEGHPDKVYFWGCRTCCGDLTISCTVENEYGAYTKEINVFVYPWYSWDEPWPRDKFEKWLEYIKNNQ